MNNDDFLKEYDNLYKPPLEGKELERQQREEKKESERQQKEHNRMMKEAAKEVKDATKVQKKAVTSIVPDDTEVKTLKIKIKQYEMLFPDETGTFFKSTLGRKTNKSITELNDCLVELDILVNLGCQGFDNYVSEMLCSSIQSVERYGKLFKYDISNLSAKLRKNKEFESITKRLFMRYGSSYNTYPIEVQLICIILCQSYLQVKENAVEAVKSVKENTVKESTEAVNSA